MKVQKLQNAVEAFNFDINADDEIADLGRLLADQQVVVVKQKLTEKRHYDILNSWGSSGMSPVIYGIGVGKLKGLHWNAIRNTTARIGKLIDPAHRGRMQSVTFQKDRRGRAIGLFTNGKLGWHNDQSCYESAARVLGLASVEGSEGSQTSFLSSSECYAHLSKDDFTQVNDLKCVYSWNEHKIDHFAGELIAEQRMMLKYNSCPLDGLVSPLAAETPSGVGGIHFPGSMFSHFLGMKKEESKKFLDHIWNILNQEKYIYTHNWRDGEVVYMDQAITLHARPTSVEDGDMRRMWRCSGYLDKLYPGQGPMGLKINVINPDGDEEEITWNELFKRIDAIRKEDYNREKWSKVFQKMR